MLAEVEGEDVGTAATLLVVTVPCIVGILFVDVPLNEEHVLEVVVVVPGIRHVLGEAPMSSATKSITMGSPDADSGFCQAGPAGPPAPPLIGRPPRRGKGPTIRVC